MHYSTNYTTWKPTNLHIHGTGSVYYHALSPTSGVYLTGDDGSEPHIAGIWYSYNGIIWVQSSQTTGRYRNFVYGNGVYVATHGGGIKYSTNYLSGWADTNLTTGSYDDVIYVNNVFFVVSIASTGTTNGIYTSIDGITWTKITNTGGSYHWLSMAGNNNRVVFGARNSSVIDGVHYLKNNSD